MSLANSGPEEPLGLPYHYYYYYSFFHCSPLLNPNKNKEHMGMHYNGHGKKLVVNMCLSTSNVKVLERILHIYR
jgi:hypothetical protein